MGVIFFSSLFFALPETGSSLPSPRRGEGREQVSPGPIQLFTEKIMERVIIPIPIL